MLNRAAIASRLAHICPERSGQNERRQRLAAISAALATLAVLIAAAWHSPAHADGGASARNQAAISAPDGSGATMRAYAQRILRALFDDDANNWVRYWQARAACDAAAARADHAAAPRSRALLALTAPICAQLDALLGVNPADYSPRGENRTVGLLLNEPDAAVGYTLFTGTNNSVVFLLDQLGRVAHAWHLDRPYHHVKLLDNGNLLTTELGGIFEFDPRGNKIWQYNICCLHHDFLKLPNGNVLLLVRRSKTREEAIAAGANPEFVHFLRIKYDSLLEVRPTGASDGEIVWQWSVWDHLIQDFDPTKPNYGAIADHPERVDLNFLLENMSELHGSQPSVDWLHTNAIDYNSELDQIMLSARNFSELWIIDRSTTTQEARGHSGGNGGMGGGLLYRWGNPRAYGHGTSEDQRLFWQHQTHWIPPGLPGAGNILLFNNGLEYAGDERHYSSVDELALPMDGYRRAPDSPYPPLDPEWTYAAETRSDFYAPVRSGAQRLPNSNTLIVDGPAGIIFQTTPDGKIVWKYVSPINGKTHLKQGERATLATRTFATPYGDPVHMRHNTVYRAYWYPPDHPGLRALDLTPGAYIEDSHDIYDSARAIVAAAAAGDYGERLANSNFDIYLDENAGEGERRLIYIKRSCADEDAQTQFFLHIFPSDARDLPAARQEHGFVSLDFNFSGNEVNSLTEWCIAIAPLPRYPIERIHTGQFTDEGEAWRAEIELGE